ncbi:MAG TPA: tRNA preQ1(34) S-adenosylmethionine ribosyltransferase-isomerase QueA [Thermomicrobiaceae bacterium]|nr:tRNA preQ1(34) S-adenosylmethionine ribosyltransferase-isomerase QueA [Thermomicrobiaceae bacterium]
MSPSGDNPILMSDYSYELPDELIAQAPIEPRDASRLLVVTRGNQTIEDATFRDIDQFLDPGDLFVINDTRVLPARLHGRRTTGGRVELLLLERQGPGRWQALARPLRRLHDGEEISLLDREGAETEYRAVIEERSAEGVVTVAFAPDTEGQLGSLGEVPLPPYIHEPLANPSRYQTVYAREPGSAAAPTAGLHFTTELIDRLKEQGFRFATVTLHVGLGTFQPVNVEDARQHHMHHEWYRVPASALQAIREVRESGHRVVAVGSTSCRTLETVAGEVESRDDLAGSTDLMIAPGHEWKLVNAMITNFHLPRTTLMLMVCSLGGRDLILRSYREAVARHYRFYSFGDAMLIR